MHDKIKSLQPQFVGKTELAVEVRKINGTTKIVVVVIDYSPLSVSIAHSDGRAMRAAQDAAKVNGAVNVDFIRLPSGMIYASATEPGTGNSRKIRVRSNRFIFSGVE